MTDYGTWGYPSDDLGDHEPEVDRLVVVGWLLILATGALSLWALYQLVRWVLR